MGKAVVTGLIEEDSKNAIVAIAPKLGRGSITSVLEEFGRQCQAGLVEIGAGGDGDYDLKVRFVRKNRRVKKWS